MDKLILDADQSIEAQKTLIVESCPDLMLKTKMILELFDRYVPAQFSQLFVIGTDVYTCQKICKEIKNIRADIGGVFLSGAKPDLNFEHTKTCAKPAKSTNMEIDSVFNEAFITIEYMSEKLELGYNEFIENLKQQVKSRQLIICTQSMLFRKVFEDVVSPHSKTLAVFEDGLQLDLDAINHLSINLNLKLVFSALRGIEYISEKLEMFSENSPDLQCYYEDIKAENFYPYINPYLFPKNVTIPSGLLKKPLLGNLRRPQSFLKMLKTVCVHLRQVLRARESKVWSCEGFLYKLYSTWLISPDSLEYSSLLFNTLVNVLGMKFNESLNSLYIICEFCTLSSMNPSNYSVVYEPFAESPKTLNPILQLACQDSSQYLSKLLKGFGSSIVLTSSCSPSGLFESLLGVPCKVHYFEHHPDLCTLLLTRGSDQVSLTTKSDEKVDDSIMRNFGEVLLELSEVVPDGILAVFPDIVTLETYIIKWNESGALYRMLENKLVLIETIGTHQKILKNFKKACECGRGAILLAVARDKCVKKMNQFGKYLKCTLIFGIPQNGILSRVLKTRLVYLREKCGVDESDYLNFDAMRIAVAAAGQGLRAGCIKQSIIFVDRRYESSLKKQRIPLWISSNFKSQQSVSTDVAKNICTKYFKAPN